jgi:branched-chain amino acid transport system permease protein
LPRRSPARSWRKQPKPSRSKRWGFQRSADVLVMLILGGTGRLYGGLIGAAVYMIARDQFSGLNPQYWYFWIGLILIAVVMLLPKGILGGLWLLTPRAKDKP